MNHIAFISQKTLKIGLLSINMLLMASSSPHQSTQYLSEQEVASLASEITVRVFSETETGTLGGSGVLIRKTGDRYTVLTNHHVIKKSDRSYQIQTPDGQYYDATILTSHNDDDVGFLTFYSPEQNYQTIPLKESSNPTTETAVIAGGFPYGDDFAQSQEFRYSTGNVTQVLDRSFVGGYQIGYTNFVVVGMSGGPVINYYGELIGINGMGKYPLFGNPYVFKDGSTVSDSEWERMSELSWAIPVEQILTELNKI